MSFYNTILNLLNKVYRDDPYIQSLIAGIDTKISFIDGCLDDLKDNFFFDTLDEDGCNFFEKELAITPTISQTIADRRSSIQAKWQSNNHNCIELIQTVCNAWKNGEVEADFIGGKIKLTFVGDYGIPDDLDGLKSAIDQIKPAHLAYLIIIKYLLIRDIHEVKTIAEMELITLDKFASGQE